MKIYHLKRTQFLPITLDEAWNFFSSTKNLARITPPTLGFKIVYISGDQSETYAGQIVRYKIGILPGITVNWMTEITHVNKPYNFIDEQRFGPYALWHHQHHFKEVNGGVEMTDELNYAIPFGFIGRIANTLFVERRVYDIFEYRFKILNKLFISNNLVTEKTV